VGEDAELFPVTPYGETKVLVERELSGLADDGFSPTYLRNEANGLTYDELPVHQLRPAAADQRPAVGRAAR
jgi:hypothetical protein